MARQVNCVLDTCALIWWSVDPGRLSTVARKFCDRIVTGKAYVSSISIWEIGLKSMRGQLYIGGSLDDYVRDLKTIEYLDIVPIDEGGWIDSLKLKWDHRDPADRIIISLAKSMTLSLVTADKRMHRYYPKCIW
jgi:PIN domain nuclease of toxin-antitoxin system